MNDDTARLDEANACHDADPARAAALLRALDPAQLPADRLPVLAFLLNHVLGEKQGAWDDAHARHAALLGAAGDAPLTVLWRQAAAAAQAAGAADDAQRLTASLADAAGATPQMALEVVALTVAMYRVPGLEPEAAADCTRGALGVLRGDAAAWREPGPLDAAVAACVNRGLVVGLDEGEPQSKDAEHDGDVQQVLQSPHLQCLDDVVLCHRSSPVRRCLQQATSRLGIVHSDV